ncbi:hypothetical protein PSACC_03484 [Paramicrosporidium saccamoebae]|uniref:COX assembly mitochondrial protein n=1 Tax=Paramicrosporidium saccamoebae TaxID=1246581 RepID=A0A2H9TG03_9FUNG|nr:hypothetical protein PSACC_03484 [Paramicrosporidium saccamoebae]
MRPDRADRYWTAAAFSKCNFGAIDSWVPGKPILTFHRTDVLKGFVTLDGPRISKAEIQLHLPTWNKGHPVPVHLHPDHTTILPQISTCGTLIELAIQSIVSAKEDYSELVATALEDAERYCRQALGTLENSDNSFPMVQAVFTGAPEDLTVSFGVQNARIVAAAYVSSPLFATSSLSGNSSLRGASRSSLIGYPLNNSHDMLVRVDSSVFVAVTTRKDEKSCKYETLKSLVHKSSMSGIGPQGSKMCEDKVAEFFTCRRVQGLAGMAAGLCGELMADMNKCLDEETAIRRRENAISAKARKAKLQELLSRRRYGESNGSNEPTESTESNKNED